MCMPLFWVEALPACRPSNKQSARTSVPWSSANAQAGIYIVKHQGWGSQPINLSESG